MYTDLFTPGSVALLWIVFLYAEVHFRIKGIFSRLFLKEPEIVADVPHRIEPGNPIPVLLLINDAHRFPVSLSVVDININIMNKKYYKRFRFYQYIDHPLFYKIVRIPAPSDVFGRAEVDVTLTYSCNGKEKKCCNDNYRHSSHESLKTILDQHPLPREKNWYYGDMHYHSYYTRDQVEFGAPIEAAVQMAATMGLQFIGIADHSYDLDDQKENYLCSDANLTKWKELWKIANEIDNSHAPFVVLPGEELSVGNCKNKNVHLLVFNNKNFIYGSGDSAEKWLATKPENHIPKVLNKLNDKALAIAAHPATRPPLIQRWLINRGTWHQSDTQHQRLDGLQCWNGMNEIALHDGKQQWIALLLNGYKISLIAGNDAHGNFSRFRQLRIPFHSIRENDHEIFGQVKTVVFSPQPLCRQTLVKALKKGRAVVSDGPFALFELAYKDKIFHIGDTYPHQTGNVLIRAKSTAYFGKINTVDLFIGDTEAGRETHHPLAAGQFLVDHRLSLDKLPARGYLRLEVKTNHKRQCISNPIYLGCD